MTPIAPRRASKKSPDPKRKPLSPEMQARVDASLKRNEEALRRLAKP